MMPKSTYFTHIEAFFKPNTGVAADVDDDFWQNSDVRNILKPHYLLKEMLSYYDSIPRPPEAMVSLLNHPARHTPEYNASQALNLAKQNVFDALHLFSFPNRVAQSLTMDAIVDIVYSHEHVLIKNAIGHRRHMPPVQQNIMIINDLYHHFFELSGQAGRFDSFLQHILSSKEPNKNPRLYHAVKWLHDNPQLALEEYLNLAFSDQSDIAKVIAHLAPETLSSMCSGEKTKLLNLIRENHPDKGGNQTYDIADLHFLKDILADPIRLGKYNQMLEYAQKSAYWPKPAEPAQPPIFYLQ